MENNRLLIGIKFVTVQKCIDLELNVLKDMKLRQLLDGIRYGIEKLQITPEEYSVCREVFHACLSGEGNDSPCGRIGEGPVFYRFLSLESYVKKDYRNRSIEKNRFRFLKSDDEKTLDELGFISSSVVVFDRNNVWKSRNLELNANEVAEAFKEEPGKKKQIVFPEYNIGTRQLVTYDTTPVELIAPGEPPQQSKTAILSAILPSLISMILLLAFRAAAYGGSNNGFLMIGLSMVTGLIGVFTTIGSFKKQRKNYEVSLLNWRQQYESYLKGKLANIRERQTNYKNVLEKRYPLFSSLGSIGGKNPVPVINGNVYSRQPQDKDFMTVRLGVSNRVETPFPINGEKKETIYSNAFFAWRDAAKSAVELLLREEIGEKRVYNLCELPGVVATEFHYLEGDAPYLYSLRNKGALGILDRDAAFSNAKGMIDHILLDLCYYHSPENLQIVLVFDEEKSNEKIEEKIEKYKFMPHFRGLFEGVSQFVFDKESANLVYGNMCKLMNERTASEEKETQNQDMQSEEKDSFKVPHVVFVVMEGNDHGLKEHAFAEFLPKPPMEGNEYSNRSGLTFLYAVNYREYLPTYCNDVLTVEGDTITITPQNSKLASYDINNEFAEMVEKTTVKQEFLMESVMRDLFHLLSTIYYARIAENGKVPSIVSMFDLWEDVMAGIAGESER